MYIYIYVYIYIYIYVYIYVYIYICVCVCVCVCRVNPEPPPGMFTGLVVQGATCAGAGLNPLNNDAPTLSAMPDVHLAWVPKGTHAPYGHSRSALIPLYVDGK